ncbi:MAG: hypothetical protein ACR2OB_05950 [Solirubrobacteraceae bacterium]
MRSGEVRGLQLAEHAEGRRRSRRSGTPAGPTHQYDLSDFSRALKLNAGRMQAVSYITPPVYQNGHAQSSDPLDEQRFLVGAINRIQSAGTGGPPRLSSPTTTPTTPTTP